MWHLNRLDNIKEYVNLLWDKVWLEREKIKIESVKKYLDETRLEWLLVSDPDELYRNKDSLEKEIFPLISYADYKALLQKKKSDLDGNQKAIIEDYNSIDKVFNYQEFISNDKDTSYKISEMQKVKTCVYCNRQYTFMVENESEKIVRPEFDHYMPKYKYPFFALSYYNLIPSCHICNSNCKGRKELNIHLNPYVTDETDYFTFSYLLNHYDKYSVKIVNLKHLINNKGIDDGGTIVKDMVDCFKLEDIYNGHAELELRDLHLFASKYSKTYLKNLYNQTSENLKIAPEEAYRLLFGTEIDSKMDNNRPLSKFKRDILKELEIIK